MIWSEHLNWVEHRGGILCSEEALLCQRMFVDVQLLGMGMPSVTRLNLGTLSN